MAKAKGLTVPNVAVSKVKNPDRMALALGKLREEGKSIQHDLFPNLNGALVAAGSGAYFAGIAVTERQKDAVPSTLQEGAFSDTIVLKGIDGKKETVIFYASNGGTKAKLSGMKKGVGVLVIYRGEKPSSTNGFNDWHDFGVEEFPEASDMVAFLENQ